MAKPRQHHNGTKISEGPGDGATEEGGEGAAVETEEEGGGGKQGEKAEDPPHRRRADRTEEGHEAREGGEEMEAEKNEEGEEAEGDMDGETPRVAPLEVTHVRGDMPLPDKNADLPGFHPERAHLLLQGVYV